MGKVKGDGNYTYACMYKSKPDYLLKKKKYDKKEELTNKRFIQSQSNVEALNNEFKKPDSS